MIDTIEGTVKWFNVEKGFGFITVPSQEKDMFVHVSALRRSGLTGEQFAAAQGKQVVFTTEIGRKGLQVAEVIEFDVRVIARSVDAKAGISKYQRLSGRRVRSVWYQVKGSDTHFATLTEARRAADRVIESPRTEVGGRTNVPKLSQDMRNVPNGGQKKKAA